MLCKTHLILMAMALSLTFFGKAIIGIALGLCVIVSIVMIAIERRKIFCNQGACKINFLTKEKIAIVLMIIAWIVSASQGIKPDKSLKEAFEYIGIMIGGLIIFTAVNTYDFSFEKFFRWVVALSAICAAYLTLTPFVGEFAVDWGSSYGSVLTIIIPMSIYLVLKNPKNINYWVCLFIISAAILASGSRTAWIVLFGLMAITPFMMPALRRFHNFALIIIVVIIGGFAGLQSYKYNVGEDAFNARTQAMTDMDRPASGRLTVWANTIDRIIDRPLLGHGIKSSQHLGISKNEADYFVLHVHNAVLEMIVETGFVGFFLAALVIIIFVAHFLMAYLRSKDRTLKRQSMAIFLACIAYGVCSMALTSMFHAWWFLYLVVLLVMLKIAELRLKQ